MKEVGRKKTTPHHRLRHHSFGLMLPLLQKVWVVGLCWEVQDLSLLRLLCEQEKVKVFWGKLRISFIGLGVGAKVLRIDEVPV
jgi:hypothetical protein